MKKSLFMLAVLAAAVFTSCENEQSSLDFAAIQDTATVQGYVFIDKGYVKENSTYVVKSLPAVGCEVLVKVPYAKYDSDAAAGDKFFEGVCDENGFYTINVPVGQEAITGVSVYTRPIMDKYYDLINGAVVEKTASYGEASAEVVLERGKTYTAATIYMQKDVEGAILTRNQTVTLNGVIKEYYEKRKLYDEDDVAGKYYGVADTRNATSAVQLVVTLTNTEYPTEKVVYNITANQGAYKLTANIYDVWNINNTEVRVEAKSYKSTVAHYYEYRADGVRPGSYEWKSASQNVSGYYNGTTVTKTLSDGDLILGAYISEMRLPFVPDYNNNTIYGIGNYDIDIIDGEYYYNSENPLGWEY